MWHNPTKWGAFSRSLGNGFTWRFYLTFTPQTQHQDGEVLHSQGLLAVTFTFFQAKSARSGADVVTNFHGEAYNSVFSPLLPHHTSMHTQSFSCVQLFVTPWTAACQAPLSMEFFRQEYWNGLLFPPPGIFPTQRGNLSLLHCRQILYPLSHWGTNSYYHWTFLELLLYGRQVVGVKDEILSLSEISQNREGESQVSQTQHHCRC